MPRARKQQKQKGGTAPAPEGDFHESTEYNAAGIYGGIRMMIPDLQNLPESARPTAFVAQPFEKDSSAATYLSTPMGSMKGGTATPGPKVTAAAAASTPSNDAPFMTRLMTALNEDMMVGGKSKAKKAPLKKASALPKKMKGGNEHPLFTTTGDVVEDTWAEKPCEDVKPLAGGAKSKSKSKSSSPNKTTVLRALDEYMNKLGKGRLLRGGNAPVGIDYDLVHTTKGLIQDFDPVDKILNTDVGGAMAYKSPIAQTVRPSVQDIRGSQALMPTLVGGKGKAKTKPAATPRKRSSSKK